VSDANLGFGGPLRFGVLGKRHQPENWEKESLKRGPILAKLRKIVNNILTFLRHYFISFATEAEPHNSIRPSSFYLLLAKAQPFF
jgi:hypothetical protein